MSDNLALILQLVTPLITVGAFYGAVKVEIEWIKKTLERLEAQVMKKRK